MKAILEFELPEEKPEFDMAINASKYYCALSELKDYLRSLYKYNEKLDSKTVDQIYDKFFDITEGIEL